MYKNIEFLCYALETNILSQDILDLVEQKKKKETKKTQRWTITNVGKEVEKLRSSNLAGGRIQNGIIQHFGNILAVL